MNQLEWLEHAYKSDKINFTKLFCLVAIITNEKETKMKDKLKKLDASFVDTKQWYSNLPESGFSAQTNAGFFTNYVGRK